MIVGTWQDGSQLTMIKVHHLHHLLLHLLPQLQLSDHPFIWYIMSFVIICAAKLLTSVLIQVIAITCYHLYRCCYHLYRCCYHLYRCSYHLLSPIQVQLSPVQVQLSPVITCIGVAITCLGVAITCIDVAITCYHLYSYSYHLYKCSYHLSRCVCCTYLFIIYYSHINQLFPQPWVLQICYCM